ncbi:MAG: hypothetical protein BJ554DRAFT_8245 [Olpidium bornovanus]|uniref:Uncharacterized protein n=1 Tax=Olpidium bornovanus TaxID=278681 RepID=A0A8H7ZVA4_9FUNG|nr:MAG: hypothetical protein BJ554DRAFT_8245 [Olpidium bornovanus]
MEKASSGYRQQVRPAESGVGADAFEIRRPDERPEHRRPVAPDSSLSAAHTREEATETDARPPGFKRAYQTGHSSFLPEFTEQISLGVAASPAGQDMAAGTTGNFAPVSGKWAQVFRECFLFFLPFLSAPAGKGREIHFLLLAPWLLHQLGVGYSNVEFQRVDQVGVVLYSGESSSAAGHLARTGDLASRQQWHSLSPVTPAPAESPVMPEGPVTPPSASRKRSVSAPDGGGEAGPYVFVKAPPPARARDDRGRVASNAEIPRSPHPGGPAAKPAWTRATAREPPPVRAGIAPHERLLPGRISVVPRDQGNFGDDAEPGSTSAVVIEEYCRPDTFGCRVAGGEAPFQPFLKDAYARRNPTQPPASTAHLGTAKYDGGALPGAAAQGAGFQGAAGRRRQGELHVAAPPDTGANRRWSHTRDNNIAIVSTSPHEIYSARGFDTVQIRRELSDLQGLVSSLVDAYNAAALLPDPDNDQSELLDQMRACFRGVRAELDEVAGQQREVALRSTGDENRRASDEAVANARSGICGVDARDLLETYSDILVGMVEGKMKVVA